MVYKHLLFDLDGTLIKPEEGIKNSLRYALAKMRIDFDVDRRYREFIGPPLHEGFEKVLNLDDRHTDEAVNYFREYYGRKGVFEMTLFPGIINLVEEMHQSGRLLYLATSKLEKYARMILDHEHIALFFNGIAGAAYKGNGSGKAELINRLLATIPKNEHHTAVMIGDTQFDIEGAAQTGIRSVGVLYGFGTEQELRSAGADCLVNDISHLRSELLK